MKTILKKRYNFKRRSKNTKIYQRLLEFEVNIKTKKYTRADIGF